MSIPERMPPRPDSIGWTPNALGPSAASIISIANPTVEAGGVIPAGARVVILHRRLTAADLATVAGTVFAMGTPGATAAVIPFMVTCLYSITSPAAYLLTQSYGVRFAAGTADILTVGGPGTLVEARAFAASLPSGGGVNAGSLAAATGGVINLRNTFNGIYLGVPGTDAPNFADVSIYCLVVTP